MTALEERIAAGIAAAEVSDIVAVVDKVLGALIAVMVGLLVGQPESAAYAVFVLAVVRYSYLVE